MPWHPFQKGNPYPADDVIQICQTYLDSGKVKSVREKQGYLERFSDSEFSSFVFSPFSSGWGASPFNPNCWQSTGGEPIVRALDEPET
jgi:hypothetical protein